MQIRDLSVWESFYWVANDKNFTKAANRLGIGVPLLSKRISLLEEQLGVRLFTRTTRKVSLTNDAERIFSRVKLMLEDLQDLEDQFQKKDQISGTIRITCITAFAHRVLAPLLSEFSQHHPSIVFELDASDKLVDLIDEQMDLAIRVQSPAGSDFIFKKLLQNNLILCASPRYLKTFARMLLRPEDLHQHPLLTLKVYENCRFIDSSFRLAELASARKIQCENGMILSELACQGAGIAVRSRWDVHSLIQSGKLVEVLPKFPLEPFGDLYAVIPTRRLMASRVRTFLDFLCKKARGWKF